MMSIPFSREIAHAYSKGDSIIDALPEYRDKFKEVFAEIMNITERRIGK
ncbi:MAG: hypothetical protein KAV18_01405 [Candidatus Omnitrophica bacterium]|nr:hypothetical protein [Candidatus Omnitrophota bacterium]